MLAFEVTFNARRQYYYCRTTLLLLHLIIFHKNWLPNIL